jgi:hypothetical protein
VKICIGLFFLLKNIDALHFCFKLDENYCHNTSTGTYIGRGSEAEERVMFNDVNVICCEKSSQKKKQKMVLFSKSLSKIFMKRVLCTL